MIYRYSTRTADTDGRAEYLNHLTRLFYYLLLQSDGDAEKAADWLRYLAERLDFRDEDGDISVFLDYLIETGILRQTNCRKGSALRLTLKGERLVREDALDVVFSKLRKGPAGNHPTPVEGQGVERLSETRPYTYGDSPGDIDCAASVRNALVRNGTGSEIELREEDLEVYQTEHMTSCATVLLLDISHSMTLYGEDRITPAKQVALALSELITRKYPRDFFRVVLFGDDAYEITPDDLPYVSVGPFHTNTKAALELARSLLCRQRASNKQIFMITDGKPSAINENGGIYTNSAGLDPKIVNRTIDEAARCRRERITITTFMVAQDPHLVKFVKTLTEVNRGRAYTAALEQLGEYVFEDFLSNRKRRVRG